MSRLPAAFADAMTRPDERNAMSARLLRPPYHRTACRGVPARPAPRPHVTARSVSRCLTAVLCLLLVLAAVPLHAQDFPHFGVLVPQGWTVEEQPEDMLILRAPDGDAAAVIIYATLPEKRPAKEVLEEYVRYFSGSEPQQRNEDAYLFEFMRDGVRTTALFLHDARSYLLLTVSDPRKRYPQCLDMVMDSLVLRRDDEKPAR